MINARLPILLQTALLPLLLLSTARAGYNDGREGMGAAFTVAEAAAITAAIGQIRIMASSEPHINTSATLIDLADCLEASLKKGKICRETNPNRTWRGITAQDNKCTWEGDAINIAPNVLSTDEPAFSQLIAVLVHEGIHAIQWNDGSAYGGTEKKEEWVAYSWEKYILNRRANEHTLTREDLAAINQRLRFVCSLADHYCAAPVIIWRTNYPDFFLQETNRFDNGRRAQDAPSLNNPNLHYLSTYPISGNIDIYDTSTQAVVRTLMTGFEIPTAMTVFRAPNGRDVLYIAGSSSNFLSGGLRTFTDLDGDGLLDQASGTALVSNPAPSLYLAQDTNTHQLYVAYLDPSNHLVIALMDDSNADGLPDHQRPSPFASGVVFPALDGMFQMVVQAPGRLALSPRENGMDVVNSLISYLVLSDTNNDGIADLASTTALNTAWAQHPSFPVLMNDVQNGDMQASVWATPGSQIQILLTDPSGNPLGTLATGLANSPNFVNPITFVGPAPLAQFFKIIDQTHGLDNGFLYQVSPNRPEIFAIDRTFVLPGNPVTLTGRNFTPNATVSCSGIPAAISGTPSPTTLTFIAPDIPQFPAGQLAVQTSTPQGTSKFVGLFIHGDCNRNGVPDVVDLAAGTSQDVNGDGIPDECERLTVTLSGAIAMVRWMNPSAVLQRAGSIAGPWMSLSNAANPFPAPVQPGTQQFFRLKE